MLRLLREWRLKKLQNKVSRVKSLISEVPHSEEYMCNDTKAYLADLYVRLYKTNTKIKKLKDKLGVNCARLNVNP